MIAITGATGEVGGRVARALLGTDFRADVRLVVRDLERAPDFDGDVRACEYADGPGVAEALRGAETVLMVSAAEVAERAGRVLGRALRFEDETVEEAYAARRAAYGAEDWQLDAWVSTYTAIADGSLAAVTGDAERVTGRPARTLEQALRGE